MAKLLQLFGITYLVGKISRSNFFFQGPGRLSEKIGGWQAIYFDLKVMTPESFLLDPSFTPVGPPPPPLRKLNKVPKTEGKTWRLNGGEEVGISENQGCGV